MKELRKIKEWTQQQVADRLHINKQTVSQYERGVREPQIETLEAIADLYNVSLNYLVGRDDVTTRLINDEEYAILERYRSGVYKVAYPLTSAEESLINDYRKLNDIGKDEAKKRVQELTMIDLYKKGTSSPRGTEIA